MRLDGQGQDKGRAQAVCWVSLSPAAARNAQSIGRTPCPQEVFWAVVVTVTGRHGSSFPSWPFPSLSFFFLLPNFNCQAAPSRPVWSWGKTSVGPSR